MASSLPLSLSSGARLEPRTEDQIFSNKNETPEGSRMDTSGTPPESRHFTTTTTTTTATSTTTTTATTTTTTQIPTFFILHSMTERPLGDMSPFFIQKSLDGLVGTVKKVTKMRSGDLLVETPNATISRNLLRVKAFEDVPISVTPHATLNYSRGVVISRDLISVSEKELLEGMAPQGVVAVKRIMLRKDGHAVPSRVLIITFDRPKLPDSVKAGYIHCSVQPYIPNPLRCFACQRFGHAKTSCRGTPICARCAGIEHDFEACEADPVCVNCQGKHPAYSRSCQKWQTEKAIQRYRVEKGVSYPEARRAVLPPSDKPSYASVVQVQRTTVETQTSVSAPPDSSFSAASAGLTQRMPCCSCGHVCTSKPQTSTETPILTKPTDPTPKDVPNTKPSIVQKKKPVISRKPTTAAATFKLKQSLKASDFLKSPPVPSQPSKAEPRREAPKPAPIADIINPRTSVRPRIITKRNTTPETREEISSPSDGGSWEDLSRGSFQDPKPDGPRDRSPVREDRKKKGKIKITPPGDDCPLSSFRFSC